MFEDSDFERSKRLEDEVDDSGAYDLNEVELEELLDNQHNDLDDVLWDDTDEDCPKCGGLMYEDICYDCGYDALDESEEF